MCSLLMLQGYLLAALHNGTECYCRASDSGDIVNKDWLISILKCDVPCAGDPQTKCGGKMSFSIYSSGILLT
jgi:hypothetical protein